MSLTSEVAALTVETDALKVTCTLLRDSATQSITDAVAVSEGAAEIPLIRMATNLINTQTLFITLITGA
jgi:hypothetical protein